MELSWLMKLRIAAAVAVGVVLVGILAWSLAGPSEQPGALGSGGVIVLLMLAFMAGLIGYFVSWPYGREIGILAAPFGLAVWAVRSGSMTALMQFNPTLAQRQALLATIRWEPIFWLAVVAAGFAGVLLGQKVRPGVELKKTQEKAGSNYGKYLNVFVALVGSGVIAQFCIRILAQDVIMFDERAGSVIAQPAVGQIVFAVLVSFGLAAFAVKKLLDLSYIWPAIASAFVTTYSISAYVKQMPRLVQSWPPTFYPNAVVSTLPVQMVAFGVLGSIAGYWMAVRFNYWRKHEMR